MIILLTGASHTGKTALAQRLLEKYNFPYLCIDHLKMGLIRSGNTELSPMSDDKDLTAYVWPIVREMIKTAIENKQNLLVEGCYIPFDWQQDFEDDYLKNIKYCCLVMSERYIRNHFADIKKYANVIERRLDDDWCTMERVLEDNAEILTLAQIHKIDYILIDNEYNIDSIITQLTTGILFSKPTKEKTTTKITRKPWKTALLLIGSPVWLSFLIAALAVLLSLYASVWSIVLSLWAVFSALVVCALGGIVAGIDFAFGINVFTGMAMIAAGLVCAGLSVFLFYGCKASTHGIVLLTQKVLLYAKKQCIKKEGVR